MSEDLEEALGTMDRYEAWHSKIAEFCLILGLARKADPTPDGD